jgi:hypothetical protein
VAIPAFVRRLIGAVAIGREPGGRPLPALTRRAGAPSVAALAVDCTGGCEIVAAPLGDSWPPRVLPLKNQSPAPVPSALTTPREELVLRNLNNTRV